MAEYTDRFKRIHSQLAASSSIHRFAQIANPQALGVSSKKDFFAPIRFNIQTCGSISHPAGVIRVDIPVHANENWATELKTRLAGMLSIPANRNIELRTVIGKPIEKVELRQLQNVGKLNIFVDGRLKRFEEMPRVPTEYSVTKRNDLRAWHASVMRDLPTKIADELQHKNSVQVNAAIRADGSLMKLISKHITASTPNGMPWEEFVRVYHMNSPVKANAEDAEATLRDISLKVLTHVRSFVGASRERINRYITSVESKQLADSVGEDTRHYAPLLGEASGKSLAAAKGATENGHEMYSRLMEDALSTPALERGIVDALYQAPSSSSKKRHAELVPIRKIATHHPWYAQIHHTLLPLRGTYPSNYIVGHTKKDMTAQAPYLKGDMEKTYRAYHLFSGQHLAPPALKVIGCGLKKKNKKKKQVEMEAKAPESISCHSRGVACRDETDGGERRNRMPTSRRPRKGGRRNARVIKGVIPVGEDHPGLLPLDDEELAPGLVPLSHHYMDSDSASYSGSGSDSMSDIDAYIAPIAARPKTSSIFASAGAKAAFIEADDSSEEVDAHMDDDFMHLPSVSDIFKTK